MALPMRIGLFELGSVLTTWRYAVTWNIFRLSLIRTAVTTDLLIQGLLKCLSKDVEPSEAHENFAKKEQQRTWGILSGAGMSL